MVAKHTPPKTQKRFRKIGIGLMILLGIWSAVRIEKQLTRPLVSVLMTVQNQESVLPAAMDSIRNQTLTDWELIVLDRASEDQTAAVLAGYARQDPRIRVITMPKDKKTVATALNKGLAKARGKYVALASADAINEPSRLARQAAFMETEKADLSAGIVRNPKAPAVAPVADETDSERLKVNLIFDNVFPEAAAMVRREFLSSEHLKFSTDHKNAEVYDLWLRVAAKNGQLGVLGGEPVVTQAITPLSPAEERKQSKSLRRSRAAFVHRFDPNLRERTVELEPCDLLPLLIAGNKEKEFVSEKVLLEAELQGCVPHLTFIAPDWSGQLSAIRGRRFRRVDQPDEKATLTRNPRGIVVEWDHRPAEQYECNTVTCIKSGYKPPIR